jgi:hypothetical protein
MPALQAIMRSEVALATKGNGPSAGEDMAHAARLFFNSLLFSLHLREITRKPPRQSGNVIASEKLGSHTGAKYGLM